MSADLSVDHKRALQIHLECVEQSCSRFLPVFDAICNAWSVSYMPQHWDVFECVRSHRGSRATKSETPKSVKCISRSSLFSIKNEDFQQSDLLTLNRIDYAERVVSPTLAQVVICICILSDHVFCFVLCSETVDIEFDVRSTVAVQPRWPTHTLSVCSHSIALQNTHAFHRDI